MAERGTSIDRIIFSPEVLPQNRAELTHLFQDPSSEIELEGLQEEEKTERQLQILGLVDSELNSLRRKFKLPEYHIPNKNTHIVSREKWPHEQPAHYDPATGATYFRRPSSDLEFADHAFHEQLHQHTYGALEVLPGEEAPLIRYYRMGLEVYSRPDHRRNFEMLNEAVTATLEQPFIMDIRNRPEFAAERIETEKILAKFQDKLLAQGVDLDPDELYQLWIETEDGERVDLEALPRLRATRPEVERVGIRVRGVSYDLERKAFRQLVEKIIARTGTSEDGQEIFAKFSKAAFTGNVLGIGKLLDKTFGVGTYRALGEQADEEQFTAFINSL